MRSPYTNRIMKKILFILSAILLFAACSDSKEETPAAQSGSIVGTWIYAEHEANYSLEITLIFMADGTYTENGVENFSYDTESWSGSGRYTYNETAQLLTMIDSEENEPIYTKAVVSGNTLTILDGDGDAMVYTRVISAPRQL